MCRRFMGDDSSMRGRQASIGAHKEEKENRALESLLLDDTDSHTYTGFDGSGSYSSELP